METPVHVAAVAAAPRRRARLILDDGGLFVAVDGNDLPIVRSVLRTAMKHASKRALLREPSIARLGPGPVSFGSIAGEIGRDAFDQAKRILLGAGYDVA